MIDALGQSSDRFAHSGTYNRTGARRPKRRHNPPCERTAGFGGRLGACERRLSWRMSSSVSRPHMSRPGGFHALPKQVVRSSESERRLGCTFPPGGFPERDGEKPSFRRCRSTSVLTLSVTNMLSESCWSRQPLSSGLRGQPGKHSGIPDLSTASLAPRLPTPASCQTAIFPWKPVAFAPGSWRPACRSHIRRCALSNRQAGKASARPG